MNIHNEVNILRRRYTTPETQEALQAGLGLFKDYVAQLQTTIRTSAERELARKQQTRMDTIDSVKACIQSISSTLQGISSNPSVTPEELQEANEYCRSKFIFLEGILHKLMPV